MNIASINNVLVSLISQSDLTFFNIDHILTLKNNKNHSINFVLIGYEVEPGSDRAVGFFVGLVDQGGEEGVWCVSVCVCGIFYYCS